MKRISITIDSKLYDWLELQSRLHGLSKSAITRNALIAYRNHIRLGSVTARAGNLAGGFSSGVKNLATDKKYMKSFGEWKR